MLASQESMLRSQPSEADYRAATVKQRPTSRRITPAEISVSAAPTHAPRWQAAYGATLAYVQIQSVT